MKKPRQYALDRQRRQVRNCFWRKRRRRRPGKRGIERRYEPRFGTIVAPVGVNATLGAAEDLVLFLKSVSDTVLRDKKDVTLDFRGTEMFYPVGAIYLYAELDRIVTAAGRSKPITLLEPVRLRPREVMKQIGLYDLTGDSCDVIPSREDVVYWKTTKGSDQSGDQFAMIESVADRVKDELAGRLELKDLWRGVSEAVANSVEHAYKKPRADGFSGLPKTKWWMFTQVRDGQFVVAVCDLGCGYRETIGLSLPELVIAEFAQMFVGVNKDAAAIHTAMEYGRTGTGESNRGKGSRDAVSVLERHGKGELYILSNTGYASYQLAEGQKLKRKSGSVGAKMMGTIVWWRLPIADGQK